MPITRNHSQELLSVAYAYAVAAQAGMNITHDFLDYGVDLTFSHVQTLSNGERRATGYDLKFQLKSSVNAELHQTHVAYDLEVNNYNVLCTWQGLTPCYLLVMRLPREPSELLVINEDLLALRNCCYWHKIPLGAESQNTETKRVHIPRSNQFTPAALIALMDGVRNGVYA